MPFRASGSLLFVEALCGDDFAVLVFQLDEVHPFGQVAHVKFLFFESGFERFHGLAYEAEHNNLTDGFVIAYADVIYCRIGINLEVYFCYCGWRPGPKARLSREHAEATDEEG